LLRRILDTSAVTAQATAATARSGILGPIRPDKAARMGRELLRHGPLGAAAGAAAIRWGDRPALTDELGTLSYSEVDQRSTALANAWLEDGIEPGDTIAILCRNHRGFADAAYAAAKAGLRAVYMNTEFAGPQINDVCEREGVVAAVFDEEYDDRAPDWVRRHYRAWTDSGGPGGADSTLEDLIADGATTPVDAGGARPTVVLLTSGTTGTPKGAPRSEVGTINSLGALLDRIPFRTEEATYITPPFFHALGFANLSLSLSFGSRIVCRRRFDAEAFLDGIAEHRVTAVVVVPALLQRTLALGRERIAQRDTSSLRIILCGGAQLPGAVATETLEVFGDVLYVLYGSTEVSYASISVPGDHREAPATVGRPALGTKVRLLDDKGREVAPGETGRIFVSNGMEFSGYTDGQTKEVIGGLMSSGDVGHFDESGRLFIDGRDDDMIVSGGENVFPQEVEELLMAHAAIADVAVVGVEDEDFGQRLAAYVVVADGAEPLSEDAVRAYVRGNLARYKVPRDVFFIEELPRNATGKILKRELAKRA
jgi:fatty-acyl-CoA synthase